MRSCGSSSSVRCACRVRPAGQRARRARGRCCKSGHRCVCVRRRSHVSEPCRCTAGPERRTLRGDSGACRVGGVGVRNSALAIVLSRATEAMLHHERPRRLGRSDGARIGRRVQRHGRCLAIDSQCPAASCTAASTSVARSTSSDPARACGSRAPRSHRHTRPERDSLGVCVLSPRHTRALGASLAPVRGVQRRRGAQALAGTHRLHGNARRAQRRGGCECARGQCPFRRRCLWIGGRPLRR